MNYLIIYLVIGLIYGLGAALKVFSQYASTRGIQKIQAHQNGYGWWVTYLVIFISRFLMWPVYVVMGICQ